MIGGNVMSAKTLYPAIPLKPIRFFRYRITHGPSKVKSGIDMHITSKEAITNELEPLCRFLKNNVQGNLDAFYNNNIVINNYNSGAAFSYTKTCKGEAHQYDLTYQPKAVGTFALVARKIAFHIYYNNYLRHVTEQYCAANNFNSTLDYDTVNNHVKQITGHSLNKKVFENIIIAGKVSNIPTINKIVIPFSDMDKYCCLPQYFKYNDVKGELTAHFRSYTGGIVIVFRLPKYFRKEASRIIAMIKSRNSNVPFTSESIFTKPTLIYDNTQSDPRERFVWKTTFKYEATPVPQNNNQVLTIDLGEKNHSVMSVVNSNGAYSNPITPGKEHRRILLKIGIIMRKVRNTQKKIDNYQKAIRKIKKHNVTSCSIKRIRDNEIAPRVLEIRRCLHKVSILKKQLSWLLARDVVRTCLRLKLSKVVTEDLKFANKGQWAKGQDLRCIQWACAKAGIEVIVTPIYYASHTCPFCWSYLQTGFGKFRISKCNGIPIPANKKKSKVHPRQKPKNSKCRWKGDRDHTACLYMGSFYFRRKLNIKKRFTVGTTPLRIIQR